MLQNIILKIKSHKKTSISIVLLIILGSLFFAFKGNGSGDGTYEVKKQDFKKTVSVAGKVVASEEVDLAFETGGTVASVRKEVGDKVFQGETIVSLNSLKLQAQRESAVAELEAAREELKSLQNAKENSEVINKKRELVNTVIESFTKADDAIRKNVDQFYDRPRTAPEIKYTFDDYFDTKKDLNDGRKNIEKILTVWEKEVTGLTPENYTDKVLDSALAHLSEVSLFLRKVSLAVNSFESSNSLSQTTIDGYKSDISSARTSISEMTSSLIDAREDYRSSLSAVSVQEANVRSAEAEVRRIDAEISDTVIRAPFSGVITLQDGKVGKSVSANEKVVGLISETFEIETFVPEVSIPGIALGNSASVTFDAYGDEAFQATVSHIDPGETEKDGVSSYKVKLVFTIKDARVRPGLTANVVIVTELRPDTLSIPERAVLKEDGKSYVFVKNGKETEKREVVLGDRDGMGQVEVLEHLNESEKILLEPTL